MRPFEAEQAEDDTLLSSSYLCADHIISPEARKLITRTEVEWRARMQVKVTRASQIIMNVDM
jgi:hypothetical protein